MKATIENIYEVLKGELEQDNTGKIQFTLADVSIIVKQNNVVGNIIEEWLDSWLTEHDFDHTYNHGQSSPDFWMNLDNLNEEWLEIKSFTGSANFDIANFMSYIHEVIDKPWKLHSKYLCIKYTMDALTGIITIDDVWLKNVWEISCPSNSWAVKVQDKKQVIYNLRPATWYSMGRTKYKVFESLPDFLSALDFVIKTYPATSRIGLTWRSKVERRYREYYGESLTIPLWQDIAQKYNWENTSV